jgi:hypothetical protein
MNPAFLASLLAATLLAPAPAPAEPPPASAPPAAAPTDVERQALEAEIARSLGESKPATPAVQPAAATAAGQGGAAPWARLLVLPDISAVGSFAAVYDGYDLAGLSPRDGPQGPSGKPTFLFQELELGLRGVIDPYFRADVFISFTPGGVSVEEAYLSTLELPGGLQVKAGKFFAPFGRLNQLHPHTWEFVDAPLARGRLLATETLGGPGLYLLWLTPLPWFAELQLAAQSTDPYDGGEGRLTGTAKLQQFFELAEPLTLGVGLSAARRDEGTGAFRDLADLDLFLRYRPIDGRAALTLQGELYARRFHGKPPASIGAEAIFQGDGRDGTGGYAQLTWRQNTWLGYGVRYDRAPAGGDASAGSGDAASGAEQRWSAVGNWYPSEFSRLALQVAHDRRPGGAEGWEAILHLEFVMGAHGAHPF